MFHGADGQNHSPDKKLLTDWPEGGPKLLWKIENIGKGQSGFSSVTIQSDRLITAGSEDGKSKVYCFDLKTRQKHWEYENGNVWTKNYVGTRGTPTINGDRVYDLSSLGQLVCLKLENGEKIWTRNIFEDFEGENVIWGIAESVLIDENRLICSPGGKKASVIALNKMNGEVIWTTPSTGEKTSYASATIFEQDGLRILATMYAKGLLGINAETGELLFSFEHTQRYDINATRPLYHNGYLVISNAVDPKGTGCVKLKISVNGPKASVEEVWHNEELDNLHDGIILIDGYLYGSSYAYKGGCFVCVNWTSGKTQYAQRDVGKACFTWADGLLYYFGERGEFRLIRPNPKKYEVLANWTLPEEGEGPYWAHPVVLDQKLYIRHGSFLYCYDIAAH